jgi:hypothetical protein
MSLLDDDHSANANQIVQRVQEQYPTLVEVRCRYNHDHRSYSLTFRLADGKPILFVSLTEERFDHDDSDWPFDAIEERMREEP